MARSNSIRGSTEFEKRFIKNFDLLCRHHHPWQAWQDFVEMAACSIANATDRRQEVWRMREDSYLAAAKRYSKEELEIICELFGDTVLALEENPAQDFLGNLYMQMDFGSGWHGQFFTPWHVAELMAKMLADENLKAQIAEKHYISVNDPCCGAGCMLMAFAKACRDLEVDYQRSVLFIAQDIDPVVAKMCYIQISLLGCPGYVTVGNTLTEPVCEKAENIWFTPLYFTDVWVLRRMRAENEPEPIQIPKADKASKRPPQKSIVKKPVKKKKASSWKGFFAARGNGGSKN